MAKLWKFEFEKTLFLGSWISFGSLSALKSDRVELQQPQVTLSIEWTRLQLPSAVLLVAFTITSGRPVWGCCQRGCDLCDRATRYGVTDCGHCALCDRLWTVCSVWQRYQIWCDRLWTVSSVWQSNLIRRDVTDCGCSGVWQNTASITRL